MRPCDYILRCGAHLVCFCGDCMFVMNVGYRRDEVERFAKDGYLAKQAFLQRADQRQAEVARSNRRKGMGLKD